MKIENLINSYDSTAEVYDEETSTFHHKICEFLTIKNMLLELPEDTNIKILDAGGGTGKYSIILNDYGYSPELIDISSKSVEVFNKKMEQRGLALKSFVCNAESTPFKRERFDFIMMNGGVIGYTLNPSMLLKEVHRILKADGKLWFDFPNTLGWAIEVQDPGLKIELSKADDKMIQMPDWDYPVRLFSLRKIEKMLNDAGFEIKSKYGLIFLSNSLPLKERYSKKYNLELLEKYKIAELELSRKKDCVRASWACSICAKKIFH